MGKYLMFLVCLIYSKCYSQNSLKELPICNLRLSCLVFPPATPLLTFEMRIVKNITIQGKTNFVNTHGINLKYFLQKSMEHHFFFVGNAFLNSKSLRQDNKTTYLCYAGYGYAQRFGHNNKWIWDNRIGIGPTLNADNNTVKPVIKTGIGRTF
jgi:hypothetical protein